MHTESSSNIWDVLKAYEITLKEVHSHVGIDQVNSNTYAHCNRIIKNVYRRTEAKVPMP